MANVVPIDKEELSDLYLKKGKSMKEISLILGCSVNKISYWKNKYSIKSRTTSEAIYLHNNPDGDPFAEKPLNFNEDFFAGLGYGLYWGEGNKKNKYSVRLGNTDPDLIKSFVGFLEKQYDVSRHKMRFSIQIFSDLNPKKEEEFWQNILEVPSLCFTKTTITKSGKIGNYKNKSEHGVLSINFHNKKLRDIMNCNLAAIAQLVERIHGGSC